MEQTYAWERDVYIMLIPTKEITYENQIIA